MCTETSPWSVTHWTCCRDTNPLHLNAFWSLATLVHRAGHCCCSWWGPMAQAEHPLGASVPFSPLNKLQEQSTDPHNTRDPQSPVSSLGTSFLLPVWFCVTFLLSSLNPWTWTHSLKTKSQGRTSQKATFSCSAAPQRQGSLPTFLELVVTYREDKARYLDEFPYCSMEQIRRPPHFLATINKRVINVPEHIFVYVFMISSWG